MTLDDIMSNVADQERGRELQIVDPWSGKPTGIMFRIAGPDSEVQRRARLGMMDDLAEVVRPDGTVSPEARETARLNCLAKCVLHMEIEEDGKILPMAHKNVLRVLRTGAWVQEQVDSFAGDRSKFGPRGE